jgi:hypothetical protein
MKPSATTPRQCYFSIIGSQRHVAEALYICSLPRMGTAVRILGKTEDRRGLGTSPFHRWEIAESRHLPLLSLPSIAPVTPIGSRKATRPESWGAHATTSDLYFALDHDGRFMLPTGKTARIVSAHIGGEYHCYDDGYPKAALLTFSARCPNVLITCISHPDGDVRTSPRAAGFFKGAELADIPFTVPSHTEKDDYSGRRYLMSDSPASNAFAGKAEEFVQRWMSAAFSTPAYGRTGQVASALLATWSPLLMSSNEAGPAALHQMAHSDRFAGRHGIDLDSITRLFVGCSTASGFGIMDATLASPIKRFAKRKLKHGWANWPRFSAEPEFSEKAETAVCRIEPDRINQLAALCANDDDLATLVGSNAGCLASGVHVVALMARLAHPSSVEDLGVRRILAHASFRFPDPEHSILPTAADPHHVWQGRARDIGPLRTLTTLAASGNTHAWDFLLAKNQSGAIRGFTKEFLAATVSATADLPLWLSTHGTSEIRALVECMAPPDKHTLEVLAKHELVNEVRGQMLATLSPPLQRPSQSTQATGLTP